MVVKIGSSTVVGADGKVNRAFIGGLADQAAALRKLGWRLVVVSSGAIACGYPVLGFDRKPVGDLPSLQACASAGQCIISSAYDEEFHARDLLTSLVLLTRHDTARRTSYLHARDALLRLVELDVVPVVNENDTVTVDEIKFGHEDPTAEFVPVVHKIDAKIIASAGDSSTSVGTGGMITKIRASRILMTAGIQSVICSGEEPDALVRLARGESVGTLFDPPAERLDIAPRKLWIALGDKAHGSVTVDDGAAKALVSRGSSLLAVGIREVDGTFGEGDVLDVCDPSGMVVARGIAEADSDVLELAAGRRQDQIAGNRLLADLAEKPAIHRDNLIVFA